MSVVMCPFFGLAHHFLDASYVHVSHNYRSIFAASLPVDSSTKEQYGVLLLSARFEAKSWTTLERSFLKEKKIYFYSCLS